LKPKYDDDIVDRCNYLLTNMMILICAITVAAKHWEQYIENFCFIENTYFVPFADDIPMLVSPNSSLIGEMYNATERNQHKIQYYQWIPFILILQALLFLLPRTIWTMFNWRTGAHVFPVSCNLGLEDRLNIQTIVDASSEKFLNFLVPLRQAYVTTLYLFCKCLNVLNIITQLYLLNCFLGMQYHFWGFGILNDLINGREWSVSGNFPRVTFC
uniref:Innexin n=1 Tax=Brugia timori TaxID=42155 RepID=A0A0R3Q3L5_9BILA